MDRRSALGACVVAAAAPWALGARAQAAWPNSRGTKVIDASAPGGSTDTLARLCATKLAARLGQPFVVENRTGAGGSLGIDAVAKSPPDGSMLLLASTAMPTAVASGRKLPFDYLKDLAPIALLGVAPLVIVVPTESPIRSLRELIDLAREKPADGVRFGSSGVGTMSHIGMELLAAQTKVKFLHVPYRGVSLAIGDLLGGQLQALLGSIATFSQLLEGGKVRALMVTSAQRSPFAPNLPTSAEAGFPDYLIDFWWGIMGPSGMAPELVRRINEEINLVLGLPDVREVMARLGALPKPGTPDEFARINAFDVARWTKVIKDANIKVE